MRRHFTFRRLFLFDWKLHGMAMLLPAIMFFVVELYFFFDGTSYGIQVIQTAFIPWIAWTIILHLQPMFNEGAYDTLAPYYRRWLWMDIFRFLSVYFIGYVMLIWTIQTNDVDVPMIVYIHHILLIFLFLFFGMALILWTKRFEYALSLLLMYTLLEVVTKGQFMPWPHVFQFELDYFDPLFVSKIQFVGFLTILFAGASAIKIYYRR